MIEHDEVFDFVVVPLLDEIISPVWDEGLYNYLNEKGYFKGKCTLEMFQKYVKEKLKPDQISKKKDRGLEVLKEKIENSLDKRKVAKQILATQPLFFDRARVWWMWNTQEFKWEVVDETDILNAVAEVSQVLTTNSKEKAEILEALRQEGRAKSPRPISRDCVQFKNKIYNIKTGDIFEATPEFFVTNPIPWEIEEGVYLTPRFDELFEQWVGKENVQKLYEIMAYSMLCDYPLHRIFCFVGSGSNGKSTYLKILGRLIGQGNYCSTELDDLLNSRFEKTRLHRKLACFIGETNFNEMQKTSMLKKLSSGEPMGFEYKGRDLFEDVSYAKLIISTNSLPSTADKTDGFYRRWDIIDFPNQFSEQEDILATITEEDYRALALKCTFVLKDLLESRKFTNEGTIGERKARYESKSNFLEQFLREATVQDLDAYITNAEFFRRFVGWCKENRHREMSETSVGISMRKLGYESERKRLGWLYDGKGGQARVWLGLKWI